MSWEDEYQDNMMYILSKNLDENSKGHTWKRDDMVYPDGYVPVDSFVLSEGYCNGPKCESCGYEFCLHCTSLKRITKCVSPMPGLREKLAEVETFKRNVRS